VAHLVEGETNRPLWAETYDRDLADLHRSPFGTRMRGTGEYARQIDGPLPSGAGRMTSGRSRIMWIEGLGSNDPRIGR